MAETNTKKDTKLFSSSEDQYFKDVEGRNWFERNILAQVEKQCVPRNAMNLAAIISGFLIMVVILVIVIVAFDRSYKLGSYSFIVHPGSHSGFIKASTN